MRTGTSFQLLCGLNKFWPTHCDIITYRTIQAVTHSLFPWINSRKSRILVSEPPLGIDLSGVNASVRFCEQMHVKLWILYGDDGETTAFIGSLNLEAGTWINALEPVEYEQRAINFFNAHWRKASRKPQDVTKIKNDESLRELITFLPLKHTAAWRVKRQRSNL